MGKQQQCQFFVPVALLLFGILGILLLSIPSNDVKQAPEYKYGIVIDAGSSHTALYIYKWPADKHNGTGIVTQHSECHADGDGISSYEGKDGEAARSLEACLNKAVRVIPKSRHGQTPVYLGATAGMRLLNISNPSATNRILGEVGRKIQSYPFQFKGAVILTGQEEGAYGWVTVNYLLENFVKYGLVGRWLSPGLETVGALDLGGASTQITFVTRDKVEDKKNSQTMQLYGQEYNLYTHSFLCYGRNQMLRRLLANLAKFQDYKDIITHPCYPAGHIANVTKKRVFSSPCTASSKPDSYNPQANLTVLGTGNYQQCQGNISLLFSFNSVFQPNVSGKFMAFSSFYYTYLFLKNATGITASSPDLLMKASRAVCNMSYEEMSLKVPDQTSRLQDYCAASVFVQTLLLKAYGFDDVTFPKISFQRQAGDTSIGWALGYMLSLSKIVPADSISLRKALRVEAWIGLIFLFSLLLIVALGYLLVTVMRGKKGASNVI